jgi:tetratricopeptide (TPR) repeat protein
MKEAHDVKTSLPVKNPDGRRTRCVAFALLTIAALAAYHNTFSVPFLFDDRVSITENPTIRHWWPLWDVLSPPAAAGVGGRPLINLTYAINYELGGLNASGYHALNLAVHLLAGLTLLGLVRRTLLRPALRERFGDAALPLALAIAVLWTVHPLQTESVTYITQRVESLMGLFYLLTLYAFVRSVDSGVPRRWQALSVSACLLGALSKEFIVTAPVMVLIYDRTFAAGSFYEAWRRRRGYYASLAGTWLLLAWLLTDVTKRGVGFGLTMTPWEYAMTSCRTVFQYLRLAIWPHPLVFDYGIEVVRKAADIVPYAVGLVLLLVGTTIALRRWPACGFLGAWFFVVLAPSTSVIPVVTQPVAEHRMYLALAPVLTALVLGCYVWLRRWTAVVVLALVVAFSALTVQRNHDYRSELSIWTNTVAKCPLNPRARYNLALEVAKIPARLPEAITLYEQALSLEPDFTAAHYNLANQLRKMPGRASDAITHYEQALRLKPDYAEAHNNLALELAKLPGRAPEAIAHYEQALRLKPDLPEIHYNLALELAQLPGRAPEAIAHYKQALRLKPDLPEVHYNLALALAGLPGRLPEAIAHYEQALRLKPDYIEAHYNLAAAYFHSGRLEDAINQLETTLQLNPSFGEARSYLEKFKTFRPN